MRFSSTLSGTRLLQGLRRRNSPALDIRVDMAFGAGSRVGYRALICGPDILGITPERARLVIVDPRPPFGPAYGEHILGHLQVDRSRLGIDTDDVAILDQRDRPALGRLRADMADAEAPSGAREAPVGDQRHAFAHAQAIE